MWRKYDSGGKRDGKRKRETTLNTIVTGYSHVELLHFEHFHLFSICATGFPCRLVTFYLYLSLCECVCECVHVRA